MNHVAHVYSEKLPNICWTCDLAVSAYPPDTVVFVWVTSFLHNNDLSSDSINKQPKKINI